MREGEGGKERDRKKRSGRGMQEGELWRGKEREGEEERGIK